MSTRFQEWRAESEYTEGQIVEHDGELYRARWTSKGTTPQPEPEGVQLPWERVEAE